MDDVHTRCREKGKGKRTSKRKMSVNEPAKDTPAEKDIRAQQEMHVEQHNTHVQEECPSDP
jgi:hypothetical protein